MDTSVLAPATQEVLNDLLTERGLTEWHVVCDVHVSVEPNESIDIIYGCALATSLQEERIDRKRKRKPANDSERPAWSCFLVLQAVFCSLSIKRLLELQQCADANEPLSTVSTATKRTFLCLTNAASVSYYSLQAPAILP
ncbi:hypothetical protein PRNP1_013584 [Phytophthora ramorum]